MTETTDIAALRPSERTKLGFVTDDNTGGHYVAECEECGQIFPSQTCDGGEQIADSGDYGDCYCPHCGFIDPLECDNANLVWNVQQLKIINLTKQLEAERQRADYGQQVIDQRNAECDRLINEIAALKGDQVPVGKFAGWGLYRESTDDFGSWLHTKPRDENDYALTQAGYVNVRLFTAPQKPVVSEGLIQLKEAVDFYLQVQKDNPPIEQGMHKDADEWLKRAAIEAAGGVVKDGE